MSLISWLVKRPAQPSISESLDEEERALRAHLAHETVNFEHRRMEVQNMAQQAMDSMREGRRR